MANSKLSDAEAKDILRRWPNRTRKLWPPPGGSGHWLRARPSGKSGPTLAAPGVELFTTQPDGLWVHVNGIESCDTVVVEICGTVQNLNDKRSRYSPSTHSLVLTCAKSWLLKNISKIKKKPRPRWAEFGSFGPKAPTDDVKIPVRHMRVLYALPNDVYDKWAPTHIPSGYEFFCPHSSLDSYNSKAMQSFLRQMSIAAQFYRKVKYT